MPTLMELLAQGGANIKGAWNSVKGGPAAPGVQVPNLADTWTPPAGKGFGAPSYSLAPDGQVARNLPGGQELFVPTPDQQLDFARNGWDAFAPGAATPAAEVYAPAGKPNVMGGEDALKVTNALASALQQSQANKPKLQQAQATSAGSVLQPKNTLLDLLAQTSVRRNK